MTKHFPIDRAALEQDDWLESLLREDAHMSPYLENGTFAARVMAALPPPRAGRRYRWIVPGMAVLGYLIGGIGLSGFAQLSQELLLIVEWQSPTPGSVLTLLTAVAVLYWLALAAIWREE